MAAKSRSASPVMGASAMAFTMVSMLASLSATKGLCAPLA